MSDLIRRVSLPLKRHHLTVKAVTALTPGLRRITLHGEDLADFSSPGADDHVKVFFPDPEGGEPVGRDYTPRHHRPDARELDLDFVLHGAGPATTWAAQAAVGDPLTVGGPRGSTVVTYAFGSFLLVADDAGLPAVARRLEELPAGAKVTALLEVEGAASELPLTTQADLTVRWLHRAGQAPGTTTLLRDAVRAWSPLPGSVFVCVGAERSAAFGIKEHLLTRGLDADTLRVSAYWTKAGT